LASVKEGCGLFVGRSVDDNISRVMGSGENTFFGRMIGWREVYKGKI
jgi:hypothetical protein